MTLLAVAGIVLFQGSIVLLALDQLWNAQFHLGD